MGPWIYLAVHDAAAIGGGSYLVTTGHPWWALVCFFLAGTTTVKMTRGL